MAAEDPNRDLGFGTVVAGESGRRLLNRDGSFNVRRDGLNFLKSWSPYQFLLTVSWPRFLGLVVAAYLLINLVFGAAYFACGPGALDGTAGMSDGERFLAGCFFSVQTFATIGYGRVSPLGIAPNLIVILESLVGLLGFALATGILFARFSRPTAKILFSDRAVIMPYQGITAFAFRIANGRSNQLVEVAAKVMWTGFRWRDGKETREFLPLRLEREKVAFFPLSWTIVHPIDSASPLFGLTQEDFQESDAEMLVLLTGTDDTFAQTVHARSSYKADEIVWGARFANMFNPLREGVVSVDMSRLHEIERGIPLVSTFPQPPAPVPRESPPPLLEESAGDLSALPAERLG
ncbi:MAG TPA: ion channel [Thermoanaerobaculia bacterium]|nr:ion channel [Thermoanaerobaculia bacterium]